MIYCYKNKVKNYDVELKDSNKNFKEYDVKFKSLIKTKDEENNTVYVYYYEPNLKKFPTILMVHGLKVSTKKIRLHRWLAKQLAKKGMGVGLVTMPYHVKRTPKKEFSGARFIELNAKDTLKFFEQAVIDIRCFLDFIEKRGKSNKNIIFGSSLGGIIAVLAMGVEKRFDKGIFMLTGGNYEKMLWGGLLKYTLKEDCMTKEQCHNFHRGYKDYIKKIRNVEDLSKIKAKKECYIYDPLTMANLLKGRDILMINARFDFMIPKSSVLEFWNAIGKPKIIWLFASHTTSIFYPFKILREINKFVKS